MENWICCFAVHGQHLNPKGNLREQIDYFDPWLQSNGESCIFTLIVNSMYKKERNKAKQFNTTKGVP